MRRAAFIAVACSVLRPGLAAAADQDAREAVHDAEPASVRASADVVRGFRTAFDPESEEDAEEPSEEQSHSVVAAIRLPVAARWSVSARAPVTTATFLYSEAEKQRVTALGNLELAGALEVPLGALESEIELGIALPTARGDELGEEGDRNRGYANLAAQRSRGFLDNALFTPHRAGIVPGFSVSHVGERFHASGFTKLELLVGGGRIEVVEPYTRVFWFGVRSWIAATLVGEVKEPDRPAGGVRSRVQLVGEPEIRMISGRFASGIGLILPLGGVLGRTGYLAAQFTMGLSF